MAASGYTPISLYYSTTGAAAPTNTNLVNGELAINITDGKLYYKDNANVVQVLASKGTGTIGGSTTQIQFNNSGALGGSANLTWDGTYLTANSIKDSALTSGHVTYAGASGLLTDSANMTFDGTKLTVAGLKDSALTSGRVTYATTSGELTDNANFTYDGTNLSLKGGFRLYGATSGYVGLQGAAAAGSTTYTLPSTDGSNGQVLTTNGSATLTWTTAATSVTISNDTATASNLYPTFLSATTGTASTIYTSNANLLYKPSTGELQSSALIASNGIILNNTTVATSYTIAAGTNGQSVGPITVNSGVTVTISSGQRWLVM